MPAVQTLMNSIINGSTDLGSEQAAAESVENNAIATSFSSITFVSSNGAILFVGDTSSTPATDWDVDAGTYFSYEVLGIFIVNEFSSVSVRQSSVDLTPSSMFGENRYLMNANVVLSASATTRPVQDVYYGEAVETIRVSIWDSSSAGSRKAFGTYRVDSSAQSLVDGLPP